MQKNEIWKDIPDYEGCYQVSNLGNVRSLYKRKNSGLIKQAIKRGYYQVGLRKNGARKFISVHRLVALAFIENPDNLPQVNHKDENKLNNNVDNLEWCTAAYNNTYGSRLERVSKTNKLKRPVLQFDLDGNFLAEYSSLAEASKKTNVTIRNVFRSCRNLYIKSRKYVFRYKEAI